MPSRRPTEAWRLCAREIDEYTLRLARAQKVQRAISAFCVQDADLKKIVELGRPMQLVIGRAAHEVELVPTALLEAIFQDMPQQELGRRHFFEVQIKPDVPVIADQTDS